MKTILALGVLLSSISSQASEFFSYDQMSNFRYQHARFCAFRADLWVEELKQLHPPSEVRKILVLFNPRFSESFGNVPWDWHIAPLVKTGAQELVYEKANDIKTPLDPNRWFKHFTRHDLTECGTFDEYREEILSAFDHPGLANSALNFRRLTKMPCYYGPVPPGVEDPHLPALYQFLNEKIIPPALSRGVLQTDCENMNGLRNSRFMFQANLKALRQFPRIGIIETKIRKHCQDYLSKLLGQE